MKGEDILKVFDIVFAASMVTLGASWALGACVVVDDIYKTITNQPRTKHKGKSNDKRSL